MSDLIINRINAYNLFKEFKQKSYFFQRGIIPGLDLSEEGLGILNDYIDLDTSKVYFEDLLDEAIIDKLAQRKKDLAEETVRKTLVEQKEKALEVWPQILKVWYKKMHDLEEMSNADTIFFYKIYYGDINLLYWSYKIYIALAVILVVAATCAVLANTTIALPLAVFVGVGVAFINNFISAISNNYGKYQHSLNALKSGKHLTLQQKEKLESYVRDFNKEKEVIHNINNYLKNLVVDETGESSAILSKILNAPNDLYSFIANPVNREQQLQQQNTDLLIINSKSLAPSEDYEERKTISNPLVDNNAKLFLITNKEKALQNFKLEFNRMIKNYLKPDNSCRADGKQPNAAAPLEPKYKLEEKLEAYKIFEKENEMFAKNLKDETNEDKQNEIINQFYNARNTFMKTFVEGKDFRDPMIWSSRIKDNNNAEARRKDTSIDNITSSYESTVS